MAYELALAQVVPWGSSMRAVTVGKNNVFLEGPDGQLWDNLRDAFWSQHLGMCSCEDQVDQLELMRATLKCVAEEMHRIDPAAMIENLFGGNEMFFRYCLLDLSNRDFVDHSATVFKHATLSELGWAVLAMLEATRSIVIAQNPDATQKRAAAIQRGERAVHA
ncbi:MAG: hypothetical protein ABI240_08860 [Sphingomonas sp.]